MTTDTLVYKTSVKYFEDNTEYKMDVDIRLSDPCKNGFPDFAITACIKERNEKGNFIEFRTGSCHDEILKLYPQFKIFVDLHNSDFKGVPMYPISNGHYHTGEKRKKYLRITDEENKQLSLLSKGEFHMRLFEMGIFQRWNKEAKKAIKFLEELTGKKFLTNTKKDHMSYELK